MAVRTLQWKVWLKEVLTSTEKKETLKWLQGITLFKDFETIFAFLLNSLTDHYFDQFLVMLVVFRSNDLLIFLLLFETMISQSCTWVLRPPKPFSVLNFSFFSPTQPQFSYVCLSSWWEVTRISLAFAQKQALVLGRPGIRNSPINTFFYMYDDFWPR